MYVCCKALATPVNEHKEGPHRQAHCPDATPSHLLEVSPHSLFEPGLQVFLGIGCMGLLKTSIIRSKGLITITYVECII